MQSHKQEGGVIFESGPRTMRPKGIRGWSTIALVNALRAIHGQELTTATTVDRRIRSSRLVIDGTQVTRLCKEPFRLLP